VSKTKGMTAKFPRTMDEALKQGYCFACADGEKFSDGWQKHSGWYVMEKDGHPNLMIPYTARYKFGRARKATGYRAKKP
jgi:hypothetical protein